jgi:hypothetical protein
VLCQGGAQVKIGSQRGTTLRIGCPVGIPVVVVVIVVVVVERGSQGPGDEFQTPWLLQSVTTSEEDEAQSRGTREGEEDGGSPSGGEKNWR